MRSCPVGCDPILGANYTTPVWRNNKTNGSEPKGMFTLTLVCVFFRKNNENLFFC